VNIRELIKVLKIRSLKDKINNEDATHYYRLGIKHSVDALEQCLSDCEAEVDNRITMLKFKMNKGSINPNIEYFRGKIFSLEQAKKLYWGHK
jgi:hypothetical protein